MQELANQLSALLARPVMDATTLTAKYDFSLTCSLAGTQWGTPGSTDLDCPDIFNAIQAQFGLRVESNNGPVETIVVDHSEKIATEKPGPAPTQA